MTSLRPSEIAIEITKSGVSIITACKAPRWLEELAESALSQLPAGIVQLSRGFESGCALASSLANELCARVEQLRAAKSELLGYAARTAGQIRECLTEKSRDGRGYLVVDLGGVKVYL